jgi:SEC-C motif-containing protein
MNTNNCYCGGPKKFQECCELYIRGIQKAPTAEVLMRSRYSAYVVHEADYLLATTHLQERKYHSKAEILNWAISNQWQQLEVINATKNTVEFKAYYIDAQLRHQIHHEFSNFVFEHDSWFYVDGKCY